MPSPPWTPTEGRPNLLGAQLQPDGSINFAMYSKHASKVTLLLFADINDAQPLRTFAFDFPVHKSGRVWHRQLTTAEVAGSVAYAYQVDGPPAAGRFENHKFDAKKVLLDPYAREVAFPLAFDRKAASRAGSNMGRAPLGLLPNDEPFAWGDDRRPEHTRDLVIYEMHVKGFTANANSGVPSQRRGTYLGVIDKIPYLQELGVTAVELMPIHQFDPQEGNYWGYMTLNFFAPHQQFATSSAAAQARNEFRQMVRALHDADIEVILDVVYNHTAEGDTGPTYSFRGIDNSTYYLAGIQPDEQYANFSGTGNTLHCANRAARRMIADSLRYWVQEMHVDGFRFDLASVFARNSDGSINVDDPAIFSAIASDPLLSQVRLIAEPWDAADGYQLGRVFAGITWMQWNGRFRDDARRVLRSEPDMVTSIMTRLYGSTDLFPDSLMEARRPWQTINYICSHDGFTMYDLMSYDQKRNQANGNNNTDGPSENFSWNSGWEGDDGVPAQVQQLRKQRVKNAVCLLMLSAGTPMMSSGDEFMKTQGGNSNPYNQDNATSWIDWSRLDQHREVFEFFKNLIAYRKQTTTIARATYWAQDITWYGTNGSPDFTPDSRSIAYHLRGDSVGGPDLYVVINAWWQSLQFTVQAPPTATPWKQIIDTATQPPLDFVPNSTAQTIASTFTVQPRSIVVLERQPATV